MGVDMSIRRRLLMTDNTLPLEYTQRANVLFNGSVYYDIGYLLNSSDRIEYRGRLSTYHKNGVFGVESSLGNSFYFINDNTNAIVGHGHLTSGCQSCIALRMSDFVYRDSCLSVDKAEVIPSFSNSSFKTELSLFVGAINKDGIPHHIGRGTFNYMKIYNKSGELAISLVPCVRKMDGEQGLFDLVYQKFYPKISV